MTADLLQRIERLERDRRRGRGLVLMASAVAVAAVFGGARGVEEPRALVATSLTIVDAQRTPRIELAADSGGAWLHLRDAQGTLMASVGSGSNGGGVLLWSSTGTVLARLGSSRTKDGQLMLAGAEGNARVRLGCWSDTGPQIWFSRPSPPGTPPATP